MREFVGGKKIAYETAKGVVSSVLFTLGAVLLFALVLDLTGADDGIIRPINQIIKSLSVFGGCLLAVRDDKGWLKGLLIGLIASPVSALLFGFVGGGGLSLAGTLVDALCAAVVGGISGILIVNFLPFARAKG